MINKTSSIQPSILIGIGFGIIMLSSLFPAQFPSQVSAFQPLVAQMDLSMPASSPSSDTIPYLESECSPSSEQTIVKWKYKQWFPCKLSLWGICLWPPLHRKHYTYKVTVHDEDSIPLRDEWYGIIPIAKGKIRDWFVYDATIWNNIADSPRQLARYPDFEPIAPNEYVVLVETRYRWFNDVESTLRICVQ